MEIFHCTEEVPSVEPAVGICQHYSCQSGWVFKAFEVVKDQGEFRGLLSIRIEIKLNEKKRWLFLDGKTYSGYIELFSGIKSINHLGTTSTKFLEKSLS